MAINQWRYVGYEDDGVSGYQCLNCYKQWSSRGAPGYIDYDTGVYKACWKFCPYCGTQWEGGRFPNPGRCESRQLGPRRTKIVEAIDALDFDRKYQRRAPAFYWLIEERIHFTFMGGATMPPDKPWSIAYALDGEKVSAMRAYKDFRSHEEYERNQHRSNGTDLEGDPLPVHIIEFRIRKVKAAELPPYGVTMRTLYH